MRVRSRHIFHIIIAFVSSCSLRQAMLVPSSEALRLKILMPNTIANEKGFQNDVTANMENGCRYFTKKKMHRERTIFRWKKRS